MKRSPEEDDSLVKKKGTDKAESEEHNRHHTEKELPAILRYTRTDSASDLRHKPRLPSRRSCRLGTRTLSITSQAEEDCKLGIWKFKSRARRARSCQKEWDNLKSSPKSVVFSTVYVTHQQLLSNKTSHNCRVKDCL